MLDYVTLEDGAGEAVSVHGPTARKLVDVNGLVGVGGVREVVRARPNGHGSVNRTRRVADRLIDLKGECWGSSHAQAFAEFDTLSAALWDAVADDRLLRWRRGSDGLELQQAVRLASDLKAPISGAGRYLKWEASLRASDPRAYSQAVYTGRSAPMGDDGGGFMFPATFPAGFEPGSSGMCAFENAGSAPTPPVFRLYGRLVDPRVRLLPDGPEIVLTGTVARGDFLELDVAARTVKLNGSVSRLGMRDYGASEWFELPRGTGQVRLLAEAADDDAYLETTYRHAYG